MINDQPDNPCLVSFSNSLALVLQLLPSSAPGDVVMCRCHLTVGVSHTSRRHHCPHLHCFLRHQVTVVVRACSPSSSSWHRDTRPRSSHHRPHALLSSHRQRCPYKPRRRRRPTSTTSSCRHQVALVCAGARCECGCGWTCMCRHRLTICIGPTSSSSSLRTALQPLPHVVAKLLLSPGVVTIVVILALVHAHYVVVLMCHRLTVNVSRTSSLSSPSPASRDLFQQQCRASVVQQGRDGEASLIVTGRHNGSTYH